MRNSFIVRIYLLVALLLLVLTGLYSSIQNVAREQQQEPWRNIMPLSALPLLVGEIHGSDNGELLLSSLSSSSWDGNDEQHATTSWMCGGCVRRQIVVVDPFGIRNRTIACGTVIDQRVELFQKMSHHFELTTTLKLYKMAAKNVSMDYPDTCARCHPDRGCQPQDKIYHRLDQAGPSVNFGVSPLLKSIPESKRLPPEAIANPYEYFVAPNDSSRLFGNAGYLFEYNPSIVRIPNDQIPDYLPEKPIYLASVRVTQSNDCFPQELDEMTGNKLLVDCNWVAILFLRQNLTIIQEFLTETHFRNGGDYRLHNLHGQLYLSCHEMLSPFWLVPSKSPCDQPGAACRPLKDKANEEGPFVMLVERPLCCTSQHCRGKNFQYLQGSKSGQVYVQTNPIQPLQMELMNMSHICPDADNDDNDIIEPVAMYSDTRTLESEGLISFYSHDELYLARKKYYIWPHEKPRGTACCIPIDVPAAGNTRKDTTTSPRRVLVGLSHEKIHQGCRKNFMHYNLTMGVRQYNYRWYAFDAEPPFRLVRVSGSFCFPFPSPQEAASNYLVNLTFSRPMVAGDHFNLQCPFIAYASTIIEALDPTKAIIGYGVNDCTTRFIEIDKLEIARALFPDLQRAGQ